MAESGDPLVLRTEIGRIGLPLTLDHGSRFLTIGSCFSDSIGECLRRSKFPVTVNPCGTVYDPLSICRILTEAMDPVPPALDLFTERDGIWYSHAWHSSVRAKNREELVLRIAGINGTIGAALATADVLMITLGTAWVYRHLASGKDVANCHKVPRKNFEKRLLSVEEIVEACSSLHQRLKTLRPEMKVVLTISPVRHVRDTLQLNSLSKAVLRVACEQLTGLKDVCYFPAYEIMVDDLRDYRFYADDLIHPTPLATGHIWEKFLEAAFKPSARELVRRWEKVRRSLGHRPWEPASDAHQAFLRDLLKELQALQGEIGVEEEINDIERSLNP